MSVERWWNYTEKVMRQYSEWSMSKYHFVYHKSHMDSPLDRPAANSLNLGMTLSEIRLHLEVYENSFPK